MDLWCFWSMGGADKVAFVDEARSFLMEAGYAASLLCPQYRFTWRNAQGDLANDTLPLVAFGAPPFTMRTACVSIFTAQSDPERNEQLQRLRFLASPVAIVNTGTTVELWAIRRDTEPARLGRADSKQWQVGLRSRIQDLSPEPLLLSKSGGYQLDFVDAGLTEWAERITEQTLTALIEDVLRAALSQKLSTGRESLRPKSQSFRQSVLRLVFHLFACRVLEDKGVIEFHETPAASLRAASDRFSDNFDPDILLSADLNPTLIFTVFEQLRTRFAFASLTTEMLGHIYENALVTPELRRENGIYYTPRIITSYILNRLPLESLPQESRALVDPCCGSGSFLLAGFDRLSVLLPTDWTSARKHQYLRTRLIGMDTDEFAIETAILSLVVRDPLNRNGWRVLRRDVQDLQPPSSGHRPTIIVTNPPFKEIKEGGARREFAAEVLIRAINTLAPGGLMGIVLPQSILDSRAGSEARGEARRHCDILEIVTLPGGLFYSNADTAVLIMRKKTIRGALGSFSPSVVTVRELHSQDLPRFRSAGGFTATYSVEVAKLGADSERRFILSPLAPL
jgi:N-6 DNA Methylase